MIQSIFHFTFQELRDQLSSKDDEIVAAKALADDIRKGIDDKESLIARLKQDVKDEVHRQKIVEKKGLSTVGLCLTFPSATFQNQSYLKWNSARPTSQGTTKAMSVVACCRLR